MNSAATQEALGRIRMEYREIPALKLTLRQARRLWNVPQDVCEAVLASLVQSGFLCQGKDGQFLRRS